MQDKIEISKNSLGIDYLTQSGYYRDVAQRSVVFYGNSYYHFHYLAQALRRRGWDAITVSYECISNSSSLFYHGEDLNLFSWDNETYKHNIEAFFQRIKKRYKLFHFANDFVMHFNPYHTEEVDPKIIEWKNLGLKIANTPSGCLSLTTPTEWANWSKSKLSGKNCCDRCNWQDNADVCSDKKSSDWSKKLDKYCDVIFGEFLPDIGFASSSKVLLEPTTMCLDPILWHPKLDIPKEYKIIKNSPDEILIYHAVGNYELRNTETKNIKGTPYVINAVNRLKEEGYNLRLIFITNMKNKEIRFIQSQADIIVDQLNAGTYGATAREGMMLGKPVICKINPSLYSNNSAFVDLPLIHAEEDTIYYVLKSLIENSEERKNIGLKSRNYALKWLSADACAERYEKIYDILMEKGSVSKNDYPSLWSYYEPIKHTII
jgi:glycosyltransferase involved in cell wall biosynthesis